MRKRTVVLAAMVLCSVAKFQPIEPVVVVGHSMEPTFHHLQCVLATRDFDVIRRGDIVVFKQDADYLIKRVAYLPGDWVTEFWNGKAWIPPATCEEESKLRAGKCEMRSNKVPAGTIYVIGDNYRNSCDSRDYGPIVLSAVTAKLLHFDGAGLVPSSVHLSRCTALFRKGLKGWAAQV